MSFREIIEVSPKLKKVLHRLILPKNDARPRFWVRFFLNRFFHSRGKGSKIRNGVRLDLVPFNDFSLGERSIIESFATVNNGVGEVFIGSDSLIGLSNVIIGPVNIGNKVILAQHVVISGLNHEYANPAMAIKDQPVVTAQIIIEDECWIGANVVITAGLRIGKHSVVAAGSVVTKDVPPFSIVAGVPAKVIKKLDFSTKQWVSA